jgi:hypothetical protein
MTFLRLSIIILFGFIGAHLPRAFTLLYLVMALSLLMSLTSSSRPLDSLSLSQLRLLRFVQLLVLLLSLTFPYAMLYFGFWKLDNRQLFDALNALLLPNALFLWGFYFARHHLRLLAVCLLSYCLGGLIFLLAALFETYGFEWFAPHSDSGSLLLPWGHYASMNVRSLEQNGILSLALIPIGVFLALGRNYRISIFFLSTGVIGYLAVLPLARGRLWIPSLVLACWPLLCRFFHSLIPRLVTPVLHRIKPSFLLFMGVVSSFSLIANFRDFLCDERFDIYRQALVHWKALIAGGRVLAFRSTLCINHSSLLVSLFNQPGTDVFSLHSVPLDLVATSGLLASLPLLIVLSISLVRFIAFAIFWAQASSSSPVSLSFLLLWSFLSTLIVQWFFQPLMYADSLLYFLSYALIASLMVINFSNPPRTHHV